MSSKVTKNQTQPFEKIFPILDTPLLCSNHHMTKVDNLTVHGEIFYKNLFILFHNNTSIMQHKIHTTQWSSLYNQIDESWPVKQSYHQYLAD